ncbi:putative AMP deaminase [Plasmodium gaboni]|uniref:AMP deaminase, putative n=1 Tax=Plasmodium gaboni TaxID=647221 RepID=A0A151LDS3_9APIC|nr:putative AMP deaminase [Plasmodium gaboni]KYN97089.1 putative AMP deaminase [Plasmodium gaboni]SOV17588.1 AMP deaminase, putative [Plasmodium gaboni]
MRLNNKNDGHRNVAQKEKGWNDLYETVVNISSKSSIKYDEYTLLNKDLNKLQTCNRFSFTLTSTGAVTKEQLEVSRKLIRLCNLRDTYIKQFKDIDTSLVESKSLNEKYKSKNINDYESSEPIYNPYNVKILKNCNAFIHFVDGIFFVHWDPHTDEGPPNKDMCMESNKLANHRNIKSPEDYLSSIQEIMNVVQDPACKSFCFQRLKYLEKKFDFHIMFNGPLELSETRDIKHRDFYNIRKVDVHVHHSACMQQKELLRFIREKYRTEPNTVVYVNEKREMLTLKSIFDEELKSTAYESTIDTLGVNALGNCFHRFDLFNEKYNPFGQKLLRDIFLKTDNYIEGRYLAEITKKQIKNLERSKYQHVEWRISIYGKNKNEWLKISKWVLNNKLSSIRVRWMIQVPRLYHIYKKMKLINTFADFLSNIFSPCFEAIKNPESNKEIFIFLHQIVGWDSVDDESIISNYTLKGGELPTPDKYTSEHNPPYSYYAYYMYINIRMLNEFMISRNMRPMAFRPHCGEIGNISHLSCMFLLADRINHGINLRKSPVLLYLYYLKQIGLALSPLSNNALFLHLDKNPFKRFFKIGLNVTLSTDDPLMFHFTDEPLLEEYSICAHTWKLSTVDLCEIARASVIQSGYEPAFKKHWLGDEDGFFYFQNDPNKTNLSNTRMVYRRNTLEEEIKNIERLASYSSNN